MRGRRLFLQGSFGKAQRRLHAKHGGLLAAEDLARFHARVAFRARGLSRHEIYKAGFWTQAGVVETLNLLTVMT